MPLLKRVRVLAAKVETTPGTAIALGGADGTFQVYNVEINPTITVSDRMRQGGFGMTGAPQEARGGTISFTINPYITSAISAPDWMSTFLPACGMPETALAFSPAGEAPGANVKTLTIGVYENGLYKQLRGCAGTFTMSADTGKQAEFNFTFTGIWDDPSDVAVISPTYSTALPFRAAGSTTPFSWGAYQPCINNFSFDLGNTVALRPCTTDASGYLSAIITDRNPSGSFDPEAALVATYDIYADWKAATERAITYEFEDGTGTLTYNLTTSQITDIQEGDREGVQIETVSFRVNDEDFDLTVGA